MKMFWDVTGVYLQEKENLLKAFITDKKQHSLITKIVLLLINFLCSSYDTIRLVIILFMSVLQFNQERKESNSHNLSENIFFSIGNRSDNGSEFILSELPRNDVVNKEVYFDLNLKNLHCCKGSYFSCTFVFSSHKVKTSQQTSTKKYENQIHHEAPKSERSGVKFCFFPRFISPPFISYFEKKMKN